MEPEEIKKALAAFEASLKPVKPGKTTLTKEVMEEAAAPVEAAPAAVEGEAACITKAFKNLVGALEPIYIGSNVKDIVVSLLEQIPECEVKV